MNLVDKVAARLRRDLAIPRANLALTFTHSHCTPKVNGASDNIFSQPIPPAHQKHVDQYTLELADKIFSRRKQRGNRLTSDTFFV